MQQARLAIIGSGPAGYTAAIYAARAKLAPVLFAGQKAGGQLMWTTEIENFPGFPEGIKGPDLMINMMTQAQKFGAEIKYDYVTAVDFSARPFKLWTALPPEGIADTLLTATSPEAYAAVRAEIVKLPHALEAESVIVATGASSIMLGAKGEMEFLGRGVSTCAVCDAAFYKDKVTYVVGGGDSAMEDTLALTKFAKSITVIHRRDSFKASKIMQERVLSHPQVTVMWNTAVKEIKGGDVVTEIVVDQAGSTQTLPADGVFIAIGHRPTNTPFAGQLELDSHGYVVTRQSASALGVQRAQGALDERGLVRFPSMTSVEGVFAAGDGVDVRFKQAITAAGQGCSAAIDAERWLESI
ncbi:FAD-dependent oxidoreductase [Candidatus Woesebacteria bacterium]|nr:FAD-dependent oxidoreductase [Candidatus Woesebacteria bacterium]